MIATTYDTTDDRSRLIGVLACHLLSAPRTVWPGSDGLTVEDVVVADYRAESDAGNVPRCDELLRQHPELVEAIRYFFTRDPFAETQSSSCGRMTRQSG